MLVVVGEVRATAARQAADWVAEALTRVRLESSAQAAEQAELRALRAEISPHFVYNALTTIASFVRSDPDRARDLILDFAEYIRHNLARRGEYATLAVEFRAIEAYLALARAVLGDRLRVQVRVAPEVLAVALPFLTLQPLVENAVQHGVERVDTPAGRCWSAARRRGPTALSPWRTTGPVWTRSTPAPHWPGSAAEPVWRWRTSTGGCVQSTGRSTAW